MRNKQKTTERQRRRHNFRYVQWIGKIARPKARIRFIFFIELSLFLAWIIPVTQLNICYQCTAYTHAVIYLISLAREISVEQRKFNESKKNEIGNCFANWLWSSSLHRCHWLHLSPFPLLLPLVCVPLLPVQSSFISNANNLEMHLHSSSNSISNHWWHRSAFLCVSLPISSPCYDHIFTKLNWKQLNAALRTKRPRKLVCCSMQSDLGPNCVWFTFLTS